MPRNYKKKYVRKSRKNYGKIAYNKVMQLQKNREYKLIQQQYTNTALSTTPLIFNTVLCVQGDTALDREGSQITVKTLNFKLLFKMHPTANHTSIRYLVVMDKSTNEAQFTGGDVLADVTAYDAITSTRDLDNMKRFQILRDRTILLSSDKPTYLDNYYKRLTCPIRYNSNFGTVADLTHCGISIFIVSDDNTNLATVTGILNVRFIDD